MLGSCTHNDGDIGKWFGTWAVQSISVDGVPDDDYHGDILWKFQSDVFSMLRFSADPVDHSYQQVWGSWCEDGDALVLRFGYSDDSYAPGTGIYAPFAETLIASQGALQLCASFLYTEL